MYAEDQAPSAAPKAATLCRALLSCVMRSPYFAFHMAWRSAAVGAIKTALCATNHARRAGGSSGHGGRRLAATLQCSDLRHT